MFIFLFFKDQFLYFRQFTDGYYPKYERTFETYCANYDQKYCDSPDESLKGYNEWSMLIGVNTLSLDSSYISSCENEKIFGAGKFGKSILIQKIFKNLPTHSQVEVYFELIILSQWSWELFTFSVDGVDNYFSDFDFANVYECQILPNVAEKKKRIVTISKIINPHTQSSMTLNFLTAIVDLVSVKSYSINNLAIYLNSVCNPTCVTCQTDNVNICLTCPPFGLLNPSKLCECTERFYMNLTSYVQCSECHISCYTCNGPTNQDCTSCFQNDTLIGKQCISQPSFSFNFSFLFYFIFLLNQKLKIKSNFHWNFLIECFSITLH